MASALSNRQNCTCARKTLQTQRGRTHGAGCVRQWFRTAEPLGERRYENWNTHTHTHTQVGKTSETDSIKFKISPKTSRGKKDSTKRHHHRHHRRQPGEQKFLIQVVTGRKHNISSVFPKHSGQFSIVPW